MTAIEKVNAREVLDSRGRPTVEVEITAGGLVGRAIAPSGASTGTAEAIELRDGGARFGGWGVETAVNNVRSKIGPAIIGLPIDDQEAIDRCMLGLDGDPQKKVLGGNAILPVSLAALHASAAVQRIPLWRRVNALFAKQHSEQARPPAMPTPMVNMISGGLHAGGNLDFQDVLLIPDPQADLAKQLESIVRVYWRLGELLGEKGFEGRLIGDEGGYGPRLESNRQAVELVVAAAEQCGLVAGESAAIALDVAASHFYQDGRYQLAAEASTLSATDIIDRLEQWVDTLPIVSIEDGLAEDDWRGWTELTRRLGDRVRLVGDDLFTTNCARIRHGVQVGAGNSVLIKFNQIGTITETFEAIAFCREHELSFVVSARSGETEDATIADLAVGVAAPEIKIGSVARGERLAKYNQLLRIHEQLHVA